MSGNRSSPPPTSANVEGSGVSAPPPPPPPPPVGVPKEKPFTAVSFVLPSKVTEMEVNGVALTTPQYVGVSCVTLAVSEKDVSPAPLSTTDHVPVPTKPK